MTRYTSSYTTQSSTTAAVVNTFYGKYSTAMQTVLLKTTDTGQAAFGTTTGSAALGTVYEVFAFTDTLQSTKPVFIRLDYVSQSAYEVYITVGSGTDGAGNVTGQWITQSPLGSNGPVGQTGVTGSVRYIYASSDGSYLNLMTNMYGTTTFPTQADNLGAITIERTRDADGTPNGNGVNIYRWRSFYDSFGNSNLLVTSGGTSTYQGAIGRAFDTVSPQYGPEMEFNALLPFKTQANSYVYGNTAMAYPVYGFTASGQVQGASKALLLGYINDWPTVKQSVPITHYGQTMQFFPMGNYAPVYTGALPFPGVNNATVTGSARMTLCPLFRWE